MKTIIEKRIKVKNSKVKCPFCGKVNEVIYNVNPNLLESRGKIHCVHIAYIMDGVAMFRNVPHIC